MDCKQCREWINDALDSNLGDREKEFIAHVEACNECRSEFEELKEMMQAIRNLPELEVPEGFRSRWQEAVKHAAKDLVVIPLWRKPAFKVALGIAAAAMIALNIPDAMGRFSQDWVMEEADSVEMAMQAPTEEPEGFGDQVAEKNFGISAMEDPTAGVMGEEDVAEPMEVPAGGGGIPDGVIQSHYFEGQSMVSARAYLEELGAGIEEQETDVPDLEVLLVYLNDEQLVLWEEYLTGMLERERDEKSDNPSPGAMQMLIMLVE